MLLFDPKISFSGDVEEGVAVQSRIFSAVVEEGAAVQSQYFFQWKWKRALLSNLDIFFSQCEENAAVQS